MAKPSSILPPRILVAYALLKGPQRSKLIRLAIDTGATTTVVPPEVALTIGCDPAKSRRKLAIITASGLEYLPVVTLPLIVCLKQQMRSFPVACHDPPPQSTVDGLLGLDFLQHVPAFREFHRSVLKLTE